MRFGSALGIVATVVGCGTADPTSLAEGPLGESGAPESPTEARAPLPSNPNRETTSSETARRNLDGQIEGLRGQTARVPELLQPRRTLVSLLLLRAQYFGTYSDFDEIERLLDEAEPWHAGKAESHRMAFHYYAATHRFRFAEAELSALADLGHPELERHAVLDVAFGRNLQEVLAYRQAEVERSRNFSTLSSLAIVEATLGMFALADAHYSEAAELDTSITPYRLAWVNFQRGAMWAEKANKPGYAPELYRAALCRLPTYVVANTHLAELEREANLGEAALQRLQQVVGNTEDPEPGGVIAEILADADPEASLDHLTAAKRQYDTLLGKHRAAFADHGAEFFSGPGGDLPLAHELAHENLELRSTARAYLLALRVDSRASGLVSREDLCFLAKRATVWADTHPVLAEEISDLGCD